MALYLKYRSKTFDELVKQDHIVNILKPKILHNDYAHSNFLFCGPRGTGKTSTARIFAKAINCLNHQDGNPCNECVNCQIINSNKTLDVVEIDAASHTGVDNIREEILDKAVYPPAQLKKKVYIIDEVHMLSKGAFNALLKIMEEPPAYLVFILATTEIQKVPETIISRCQIFTFKKIPVIDLVKHLTMICEKEGMKYENDALLSIAKISD
jgi:DNA polymerase-3 subunit gamma/tau